MYIPDAFAESRLPVLHEAINACGLAIFVTAEGGVPCATHAPMLLAPEQGQYGTLHFHLARANQQWRTAAPGATALVIFPGPDGYVSPSWYKSKAEHGRVVPTWNYVTVHAEGVPAFYDDRDRLLGLVSRLTNHHEASRDKPWQVADAPEAYTEAQLRGIVGVELPIARLQGSWKLGQNRNEADRAGLLAGYEQAGGRYANLASATRSAAKP
jgi:transcriptional regulator